VSRTGEKGTRFFARSSDFLCQGVVLGYPVVERSRHEFPMRLMCRCLRVSASGYYDWSQRLPSARHLDNERLSGRLRGIHEDSRGALGDGRLHEDRAYEGQSIGLIRVALLMAAEDLQGWPSPKRRVMQA
jgi:putative transposase